MRLVNWFKRQTLPFRIVCYIGMVAFAGIIVELVLIVHMIDTL